MGQCLDERKAREGRFGGHHHCLSGAEGQTPRPRGQGDGDWVKGDGKVPSMVGYWLSLSGYILVSPQTLSVSFIPVSS